MDTAISTVSVPGKYKALVQLIARALYTGHCPPMSEAEQPKTEAARKKEQYLDLAVIVLDALTRREWVKEDELALDLKLAQKVLRRATNYLEQQMLVTREQRREKHAAQAADAGRGATPPGAATASTSEAGDADPGPSKQVTVVYCKLDYRKVLEGMQLRMQGLRAGLKEQGQINSVEQYYRCTTSWCAKEATTLDAFKLIKDDGNFHCDVCDAVMEGIDQPGGSGMEQAQTRAAAQKLQSKLPQLQPIFDLVDELAADAARSGQVPDFRSYAEWLRLRDRAIAEAARASADLSLPQAFAGEAVNQMNMQAADGSTPKELPPWLRRPAGDAVQQDSHANGHASFAAADDHTRSREGIDHEPESKRVKARTIKSEGGWDYDVSSGQGVQPMPAGMSTDVWVPANDGNGTHLDLEAALGENSDEWED